MEKYLNLLKANAVLSPYRKHPMAACIVCKGEVISCETNSLKTHPLQKEWASKPERIHLHAEIACLVRARWPKQDSVRGGHMYIGRLLKNDSWGSSAPCGGCLAAIIHSGIEKITYFETSQGFFNKVGGYWRTVNV